MADSCSSLEPVDRIVGQILEAIHFAATKHKDQRRKDPEKTPYINHPIGVAYILLKEGGVYDTDVLQVRSTVFAQRNLYVPSVRVFTTHQFCVNLRDKNCIYRLSFLEGKCSFQSLSQSLFKVSKSSHSEIFMYHRLEFSLPTNSV